MKKNRRVALVFFIISVLLSSCGKPATVDAPSEKETTKSISYSQIRADWPVYTSTETLVEEADLIFAGEIIDISFNLLDAATAYPPTDKSEKANIELFTFYNIKVSAAFKGNPGKEIQVKAMGGIADYKVDEQLALLKSVDQELLPLVMDMPELNIGDKILFVVKQNLDRPAYMLNLDQSFYNLSDPMKKQYGSSAKDIISYFGEETWNIFWPKWQKDNPGWEQQPEITTEENKVNETGYARID